MAKFHYADFPETKFGEVGVMEFWLDTTWLKREESFGADALA